MHAPGCETKELTRLLWLEKSGEPPEHPDHMIGYDHDLVEICPTCDGATLERLRHDCFDYEDVWDQYEWYELTPADGARLRTLAASCPTPLDHNCTCALHTSLRGSAKSLPIKSWEYGFEQGAHPHLVKLTTGATPTFHLVSSDVSATSPMVLPGNETWEIVTTVALFLTSYVGLLVTYYRATSHAWLLNTVVTVGLLPVTLLGAAMIVALAHVIRRVPRS